MERKPVDETLVLHPVPAPHTFSEKLYRNQMRLFEQQLSDVGPEQKLRTYKTYKSFVCMEPYLLNVKSTSFIRAIARFRLSAHNLQVELGRHTRPKTPLASRLCQKCNLNTIEDEIHFLIECPSHEVNRHNLFNVVETYCDQFENFDTQEKFIFIMSCRESVVSNALGKFLYKCL